VGTGGSDLLKAALQPVAFDNAKQQDAAIATVR